MMPALRFVDDGIDRHEIAYSVLLGQIRAQVEAEFAEELTEAGWWQWMHIRRKIRQEAARRAPKPPSGYNLYGRSE